MSRYGESILLADCKVEEVITFVEGLNAETQKNFSIKSHIANLRRNGKVSEINRYFTYFSVAWKYYRKRNKYDILIGWQQFYALIIGFYYSMLHAEKCNTLVALNFTYIEKKGVFKNIYRWFIGKCLNPAYMDYLHVLSFDYANKISQEFCFPRERILVTPFGVDDCYPEFSKLGVPEDYRQNSYAIALGRSNRDFDFLIECWDGIDFPLVVIGDTYRGTNRGNNRVRIRKDIGEMESHQWIANCRMMIIPLKDPSICSGDTVLLNAMACKKTVVVTAPSTLSEMYITNGTDGYAVMKDKEIFRKTVNSILASDDYAGINARNSFLKKFSRISFGKKIGKELIQREDK